MKAAEIRVLHDLVLLKVDPLEEKTASGLEIPASYRGHNVPAIGAEVVSVGPGAWTEEGVRLAPALKPGQRVLFARLDGFDVSLEDGTKLRIIEEKRIFAVIG